MSTVTFDKLTYVARLEKSGVAREQAEAQADALDVALRDSVATKHDIELVRKDVAQVRQEIELAVAPLRARLDMVQWLVSGIGFGVLLLVLRSFWPV